MRYLVELEDGVWLAPWDGDPGRTLVKSSAQSFSDIVHALVALEDARQYREFVDARVILADWFISKTLRELKECAESWVEDVRLIGNVRAGDIAEVCGFLHHELIKPK